MKNPDLLICWHESCDFPIARRFLRRHRNFFGKIIIYFSKHFRGNVYTPFLKSVMEDLGNTVFLDPIEYEYGVSDWRNVATHYMLEHSNSEWVCSVEGDFFANNWDKLLSDIAEASKTYDLLGYSGHQGQAQHQGPYLAGNYVHPAFWFMKRSTLEKTNMDFSADPKRGADHFGLITQDANRLGIPIWYMQDHGWEDFKDAFHQGGINQAYLEFPKENFASHRPDLFYIYNHFSMKAEVPQDPKFMDLCSQINEVLKKSFPDVDPENNPWSHFYV